MKKVFGVVFSVSFLLWFIPMILGAHYDCDGNLLENYCCQYPMLIMTMKIGFVITICSFIYIYFLDHLKKK